MVAILAVAAYNKFTIAKKWFTAQYKQGWFTNMAEFSPKFKEAHENGEIHIHDLDIMLVRQQLVYNMI